MYWKMQKFHILLEFSKTYLLKTLKFCNFWSKNRLLWLDITVPVRRSHFAVLKIMVISGWRKFLHFGLLDQSYHSQNYLLCKKLCCFEHYFSRSTIVGSCTSIYLYQIWFKIKKKSENSRPLELWRHHTVTSRAFSNIFLTQFDALKPVELIKNKKLSERLHREVW